MTYGQSSLFLPDDVNYVAIGDLDVPGDQLTVEALIHHTGVSVNVVSKHTDPGNVNYLLRIGSFEITTTDGFANFGGVATAGVTLDPGNTYHIAATYNGQFIRYYVNGCLTGEMAWSGDMVQNDLITAIGQQSACECEQFRGYIDEVRIWNVARTQQEIADNMLNLPNPGAQVGLLAYYKFDNNLVNAQGNAAWDGVPVGVPQFDLIPEPYPQALSATASSSDPLCNGENNSVINGAVSGGYEPYEYSIDGTNFGPASDFDNLPPGGYTFYARPENNADCISTSPVMIMDPAPIEANLTTNDASCFDGDDGSATINPAGGNGPDFEHTWNPDDDLDLTVTDLIPGNYSVDIEDACKSFGHELVVNGHFEDGDMGFNSDLIAGGVINFVDGQYTIGDDPSLYNPNFEGTGNGGGGNFMIVNGSSVAGQSVWCQTINVTLDTDYNFSMWIASLFAASPAELFVEINGVQVGGIAQAPGAADVWEEFTETWNSGANTQADICIYNQNLEANGNDFGLDDISFKECASCSINFPFVIDEPTELVADITFEEPSCFNGDDASITINANGGTPDYEYSVDGGATFQANDEVNNLDVGTFDLVVRDANGCEATGGVTITQPDELSLAVSDDEIICENAQATLQATAAGGTPPYNYNWSNGLGNNDQHTVSPNQETTYSVSIMDANGCTTDNASITVEFYSEINILVVGPAAPICYGEDALISVFATSGEEPFTYNWTNSSDAGWQGQGGAITYPVTDPTTFTVEATDNCNTTASESVQVEIFDLPEPVFGVTEAAGCYPFTTTLYNTTTDPIAGECVWGFGDGEAGFSCDSITHEFTEPGCYDITLMVTSPEGCTNTMTYNNFVCAEEAPDVDFIPSTHSTDVTESQITFSNLTPGVNEYVWNFGGLATSNMIHPTYRFPTDRARSYEVCLEATSAAGCVDTTCKIIAITEEFTMYVPNAFTPDGDGFNDYFGAVVKGYEMTEFSMLIYNRNGELIFESVNSDSWWDGRHRGSDAPQGVYVWKITVRESNDGEKVEKVGHVTLLR